MCYLVPNPGIVSILMRTVLYLQYTHPAQAVSLLRTALSVTCTPLVCEVFSPLLTPQSLLPVIQQLYSSCFRPFARPFYVTGSSLGLGRTPSPASFQTALVHSPLSSELATQHGFLPVSLPETVSFPSIPDFPFPLQLTDYIPHLPGQNAVYTGTLEAIGPGELSLFSLCGLYNLQEVVIRTNRLLSHRWISENIEEFVEMTGINVNFRVEKGEEEMKSELRCGGNVVVRVKSGHGKWLEEGEIEDLRRKWTEIMRELEVSEDLTAYWFLRLSSLYQQPHRHYHTLTHIRAIFTVAAQTLPPLSPVLSLAIWFHDAIYDPKSKDNEDQSAALLVRFSEEIDRKEALKPAAEWILATKEHIERTGEWEEKALLDVDLSVLGGDEESYGGYRVGIYREYEWIGEREYRQGRMKVIQGFLDREKLYYLQELRERWEMTARHNLQSELVLLSTPSTSLLT